MNIKIVFSDNCSDCVGKMTGQHLNPVQRNAICFTPNKVAVLKIELKDHNFWEHKNDSCSLNISRDIKQRKMMQSL